ncbi:citrate lyase acyl carrier protein [Clostridium magnum]|uniref:Citrate lyase acyl carrier protein n=1 Tax=Clostridium magnum DSM 2767 TaxID=1121326 RepID=A0A162QV71_9CLOT|nr:citrate lyase acyl carrier protein [Clostridium magnum]KZL89011.1 citrate lyase acyl carrier protein [Clostridium magnum DSM 2767]SHI23307.1 citrate lyase subunit gamma (acyl carrier protein) [Clostridium magnum DSM 2767]
MDIIKVGICGTVESSDITVIIEPNPNKGIEIELDSSVEIQFGEQIREVITSTLLELNIENARVVANDKGALDCVIKARVQAAAYRAAGSVDYKW